MPRMNKKCHYPGCEEFIYSKTAKYCQKHRCMKPYRTLEAKAKAAERQRELFKKTAGYGGVNPMTGVCARCQALPICRTEIERPTFWPPCTPESRFYDPSLIGDHDYRSRKKLEAVEG